MKVDRTSTWWSLVTVTNLSSRRLQVLAFYLDHTKTIAIAGTLVLVVDLCISLRKGRGFMGVVGMTNCMQCVCGCGTQLSLSFKNLL